MYTAKEAREKAEQSISDETKEQLEFAERCIGAAVEKGEMCCWCGKYLEDQAIKKLEELGYKVDNHSSQRDGVDFKISW